MTAAQRRAINRHNARKSTGPITPEGKERARQNALKHGLCAAVLALPIENADDLQAEFDGWVAHYQPVGPAEFAMVEEIAHAQLRLRRCRRSEGAVVELQVHAAYRTWSDAQDDRLHALQQLLAADPAAAVRQLRRFGPGRRYMIDRWKRLGRWFLRDGYCNTTALVEEAVRLIGADPQRPSAGPPAAYEFRVCCTAGRPLPNQAYLEWLLSDAAIHPEYHAEYGRAVPETDDCRDMVRKIVAAQIEALEQEEDDWRADEQAEAAGACLRAQVPCDNPDTKLTLRYEAQARGALHKAMKALDVLQDARYAAEAEGDEADAADGWLGQGRAAAHAPAHSGACAAARPCPSHPPDSPPGPLSSIAPNEAETPQEPPSSAAPETNCDTSTDTNPDVANGVAEAAGAVPPTPCGSCLVARQCPCHCGPPVVTVVPPARADSPPA